jgi:hypothetical protein
MMPLDQFESRTFSALNLLTLLLYGALAGTLLFLRFDLIQLHGCSATLAGAALLPFPLIIARYRGGRPACSIASARVYRSLLVLRWLLLSSIYWQGGALERIGRPSSLRSCR